MPMPKKSKAKTPADRKATILWPFLSFAEEGIDELVAYLLHVGIDDRAIKYAGGTAEAAILNHYRIGTSDHFDIEKAAADLKSYPPIARRIAELRAEQRKQAVRFPTRFREFRRWADRHPTRRPSSSFAQSILPICAVGGC